MPNRRDDTQNTHGENGVRYNSQGSSQKQIEEISDSTRVGNDNINEAENIVKTRYGTSVRKLDSLMYQKDHTNACPANMLGNVKMSHVYHL